MTCILLKKKGGDTPGFAHCRIKISKGPFHVVIYGLDSAYKSKIEK